METFRKLKFDPMQHPAVLVASHGPFTWGKDVADAVHNAGVLEFIAQLASETLRINPKLTRFERNKVAPDNNTYPIQATKTIQTMFCLESGKTAAIGGLTETSDRDVTSKVPLLGDLPLVGKFLFTHTHKERSQQETIIFVTVGIANPQTIAKTEGLPEDADLTQRHLANQKVTKVRRVSAEKSQTALPPPDVAAPAP